LNSSYFPFQLISFSSTVLDSTISSIITKYLPNELHFHPLFNFLNYFHFLPLSNFLNLFSVQAFQLSQLASFSSIAKVLNHFTTLNSIWHRRNWVNCHRKIRVKMFSMVCKFWWVCNQSIQFSPRT
jgi:hypothetical protein